MAGRRPDQPGARQSRRAAPRARARRRRPRALRARQPRDRPAADGGGPARAQAPRQLRRRARRAATPRSGSTGCGAGRCSRRASSAASASRWCTPPCTRTGASRSSSSARGGSSARLAAPDRREAIALLAADPARDPDRDLLGRLTQCRSVTRAGGWSAELPGGELEAWHRRAGRRAQHDYCVVYGHWALQGLHVAPRLRGLDTGCVHHGRGRDGVLTAWLPDPTAATPFDVPDEPLLADPRAACVSTPTRDSESARFCLPPRRNGRSISAYATRGVEETEVSLPSTS